MFKDFHRQSVSLVSLAKLRAAWCSGVNLNLVCPWQGKGSHGSCCYAICGLNLIQLRAASMMLCRDSSRLSDSYWLWAYLVCHLLQAQSLSLAIGPTRTRLDVCASVFWSEMPKWNATSIHKKPQSPQCSRPAQPRPVQGRIHQDPIQGNGWVVDTGPWRHLHVQNMLRHAAAAIAPWKCLPRGMLGC